MKKTRIIVLSLVLCLVLMGSAFAYWNQDVVAKATVKTGNMNVDIDAMTDKCSVWTYGVDNVVIDNISGLDLEQVYCIDTKIENDGKDTVKMTLTNACPGICAGYEYKIINRGSVPVKLEDAKVTVTCKDKNVDLEAIRFKYNDYKDEFENNGDVCTRAQLEQKIKDKLCDYVVFGSAGNIQKFKILLPTSWGNESMTKDIVVTVTYTYTQANDN